MKKERVRHYGSFFDDFDVAPNQDYSLPEDYVWVRKDFLSKLKSGVIYFLAIVFSLFYCPLILHTRVKGRKNLRGLKGRCFIYGNHTQPLGDVFIPALCVLPKRIFTVVSTANFSIPVIGKILPYLGALPIVDSLKGFKELTKAMEERLKKNHPIVIYPEAHVWEYCSFIRPFPCTSFKFPVKFDVPAVAMTVTYKKSKFFKKPKATVYLDGPFYPHGDTIKEKTVSLHKKVYSAMCKRSKESDCQYISYIKED